jgi:O-antigen ligase
MAITRCSDAGHGVASTDSYVVGPQIRWAFYAVVASLSTEGVSLGIPVTAPRILGYVFFLLALLQPRVSFRLPPPAFWWFGIYVYLYAALTIFQPSEFWEEIMERVLTLVQLLAFFWIGCNLMRDPRVAWGAIVTLGLSCALCALLQLAGLATDGTIADRAAAFEQNANQVATIFSLGLLALVGLIYGRQGGAQPIGWWAWPLCAVLALAIVQTGSRGGLLTVGSGLLVFLFDNGRRESRMGRALFVALGAAVLIGMSYFSEASRQRWEETFGAGDLAHREELYPTAWQMFIEKPVAGWGPVTALYELGARTKHVRWSNPEEMKRDTHNLALHVLTATGILGAVPFVVGMWLCVRAAWRARPGPQGVLPLALVISLLVSNMSGDRIYLKFHWFVLAYALASWAQLSTQRAQPMALRNPQPWVGRPVASAL